MLERMIQPSDAALIFLADGGIIAVPPEGFDSKSKVAAHVCLSLLKTWLENNKSIVEEAMRLMDNPREAFSVVVRNGELRDAIQGSLKEDLIKRLGSGDLDKAIDDLEKDLGL